MVRPLGLPSAGLSPSVQSLGGQSQGANAASSNPALFEGFGQGGQAGQQPDMFTMMGMLMSSVMMMVMMVISTLSQKGPMGALGLSGNPGASGSLAASGSSANPAAGGARAERSTQGGTNTAAGSGIISTNGSADRPSGGGNGKPQVIIEGDSLSTGTGSGSFTYADQLAKKMGGQADFVFKATSGDRLGGGIGRDAASNANAFDNSRRDNVVVLWGGTNDLHGGASGADTYNKLVQTAQAYKDKGFKVVVLTSIQLGENHTAEDEQRLDFNNRIRNGGGPWDSVVDVASLPQFSDRNDAAAGNRQYYAGDGTHLTAAGYGLIADQVQQALNRLLGG